MTRVTMYGLQWELDSNPIKGQLGLLKEDHYAMLFRKEQIQRSLDPADVWLDVGANIGAFAVRAAMFVKEVIAVEPEEACFKQLKVNAELNGALNIYPLKAAVVTKDHGQWVDLAISNSFSSTHRIGRIRGRKTVQVAGIEINTIVEMYKVNKIKMDCESCEAELLEALDLEPIEEIVFEYHFAFLKDHDWSRFYAILDRLRDAGFAILKSPKEKSKTWHCIVWAWRP